MAAPAVQDAPGPCYGLLGRPAVSGTVQGGGGFRMVSVEQDYGIRFEDRASAWVMDEGLLRPLTKTVDPAALAGDLGAAGHVWPWQSGCG